jgi:hypothetical protein
LWNDAVERTDALLYVRLVKLQDITLGAGKSPLPYRMPGDANDIAVRSFG